MIVAFKAGGRTRTPNILPNIRNSYGQRFLFNVVAVTNSFRHSVRPHYAMPVIDVSQCLLVLPQSCICQNFVNNAKPYSKMTYKATTNEDCVISICGIPVGDVPGTQGLTALVETALSNKSGFGTAANPEDRPPVLRHNNIPIRLSSGAMAAVPFPCCGYCSRTTAADRLLTLLETRNRRLSGKISNEVPQ